MDNDYYVDVVTKNILSALAEHISDAIADQLISVVKKTTAALETKLFTMFDSVSKDIAHSVSDNMHASNERLQAIEETLTEVKQKLGALNTEQIDAMAKSVEGGLASIAEEIKVSMGENNKADMDSLKTSFNDMAAKIERIDASVVNSLATILENTTKDVQSAAGEEIKTAISAEFRAIQQSLSAATTGQAEILRMMLEEQFRQAEAQVERAHSNKQEIEERLKRLGGFLADTAAK